MGGRNAVLEVADLQIQVAHVQTPPRLAAEICATQPFYSIADLASRWRCSRGSVYNRLRGEKVVDFAAMGRKGKKLVPLETVQKIERAHLRVLR
jgi:hypothetical protein